MDRHNNRQRPPCPQGEALILVAEDDLPSRVICSNAVSSCGYSVVEAGNCAEAERQCRTTRPHAAVLDYLLGDGDALALMGRLREIDPHLPIVILTAHGSIELAVEAMQRGADHFLTKPVNPEALAVILERCLADGQQRRRRRAYDTHRDRYRPDPFRGQSAAIRRLEKLARKVCCSESPVLLLGETGCGKGVLARWLHDNGPRAAEAFVELNCAALKPEFLESELFGYNKGAFTGATDSKPGLLEIADRGTLFLDELGDMDLAIQTKLLKVLEEQTFHRLGEVTGRRVDVRLVAATQRDLREMVRAGTFRSDLYFRINTLPLDVPLLRRRREDIPSLVEHLLARLSRRPGRHGLGISPQALEMLARYPWPGNIRELRNVLERAVILAEDEAEILDTNVLFFDAGLAREESSGTPAAGTPAAGTPAAGTPAAGTPAAGTPARPRPDHETKGHRVERTKENEDGSAKHDATAEVWEALRAELRRQIETATAAEHGRPLGRWLADDFLLAAAATADGNQHRGAALLGIARSSFVRQLRKAEAGAQRRPSDWEVIRKLLADLLRVPHPPGSNLPQGVRRVVLEEVTDRWPGDAAAGAALLGVSEPTFRSWRKALPRRS